MNSRRPWYASPLSEERFIPPPAPVKRRVSGPVFHSPDGVRWPLYWAERLRVLAYEYKCICRLAGIRFPVVSGYRTLDWQYTYYHWSKRTHVHGQALDLWPAGSWTIRRMATIAEMRRDQPDSRLTGIGINPEWLHIDIRPRKMMRTWTVKNPRYED